MNIVLRIKEIIKNLGFDDNPEVLVSNRPDISDYQYNGAFRLAKIFHKAPNVIADEIVSKLSNNSMFKEVKNVNGFINLTLSDDALVSYINEVINNFDINTYKVDTDEVIFLDYGGANVAKSLHVGHLRSPNIGEAIKRLCEKIGYKTISDVHYGDWGRPMGLIICEIYHMYPELDFFNPNLDSYSDVCPVSLNDLYEIYPRASIKAKEDEDYLNEARLFTVRLQNREKGIFDLYKTFTKLSILDIEDIYKKLNCTFDLFEGERDADNYIKETLEFVKPYTSISNGATIIDVKEDNDKKEIPPVILIKSDGGVLYDTTELATLYSREKRFNISKYFYFTDVRQELHFVEAFRAAYKTGIVSKDTSLEWFGFGTITGPDGKPFKTRDGNLMSLRELIDIVKGECIKVIKDNILDEDKDNLAEILAISAIKYADLLPNRSSDYIFDPIKFSDINGKTGPYILYSTVRMKSLINKANFNFKKYHFISTKEERDIIINIIKLRSVIEKSFNTRSLNEICEYIYKLTSSFNAFYSNHEVLSNDNELVKESYLSLINLVYEINKYLLDILAITLPDKI